MAPKKIKVYQYEKCSTCRKALKFLDGRGLDYESIPIVARPPALAELAWMLEQVGELRKLFNTSGELYREMNLSERLKSMDRDEALKLLAGHGKLIKRPFVLAGAHGLLGFDEAAWKSIFK